MRLVVLCPHFAPDVAPTGEVMTRIVEELASRGHRSRSSPRCPGTSTTRWSPSSGGDAVRRETHRVGRISRVHPFPTDKRNIPARALAFGGFTALARRSRRCRRGRPDVVLAMSPPLTLGLTGWAVALARASPVRLQHPGRLPRRRDRARRPADGERVIAAARWLERVSYAAADAVTVLSDDLPTTSSPSSRPPPGAPARCR